MRFRATKASPNFPWRGITQVKTITRRVFLLRAGRTPEIVSIATFALIPIRFGEIDASYLDSRAASRDNSTSAKSGLAKVSGQGPRVIKSRVFRAYIFPLFVPRNARTRVRRASRGENPSMHETVKYLERPHRRDISPVRPSLPVRGERKSKRLDRNVGDDEMEQKNARDGEGNGTTLEEYKIDRNIKKRKVGRWRRPSSGKETRVLRV